MSIDGPLFRPLFLPIETELNQGGTQLEMVAGRLLEAHIFNLS